LKEAAQIILVALLIMSFFIGLYRDINGRPAKEPEGFGGVVTSIILLAVVLLLYYFAGALSIFLN